MSDVLTFLFPVEMLFYPKFDCVRLCACVRF